MADYDRLFQIERRMSRVQRNRLEGAWFCAGALADDTLYQHCEQLVPKSPYLPLNTPDAPESPF